MVRAPGQVHTGAVTADDLIRRRTRPSSAGAPSSPAKRGGVSRSCRVIMVRVDPSVIAAVSSAVVRVLVPYCAMETMIVATTASAMDHAYLC